VICLTIPNHYDFQNYYCDFDSRVKIEDIWFIQTQYTLELATLKMSLSKRTFFVCTQDDMHTYDECTKRGHIPNSAAG